MVPPSPSVAGCASVPPSTGVAATPSDALCVSVASKRVPPAGKRAMFVPEASRNDLLFLLLLLLLRRAAGLADEDAPDGALEHGVSEGDAKGREEVVEGGDVGPRPSAASTSSWCCRRRTAATPCARR